MKTIIIGTSLAGKTTIVRYLRSNTNLNVSEIDEELTQLNNGEYPSDAKYKNEVLAPKIIKDVLEQDDLLFFTNTHYFTESDLKVAKNKGFKVVQLSISLEDLKKRNIVRIKEEGYADFSQWLKGMLEYQASINQLGLVDLVVDANLPVEQVAKKIISI